MFDGAVVSFTHLVGALIRVTAALPTLLANVSPEVGFVRLQAI